MKYKIKLMKVSDEFDKLIKKAIGKRMAIGKDTKPKPNSRITLALSRHNFMQKIIEDIVNAELD